MTDPREDAAREWLDQHRAEANDDYEPGCFFCVHLWSEHAQMLLAAIDAADRAKDTP